MKRRRSKLLSRLRKIPVSELLLVNPEKRKTARKRRTKMARKRKWGSRKQRAALRKMIAARKRSLGGKHARRNPRRRRFTAKARAASMRNLRKARIARLRKNPHVKHRRRGLRSNPFGKSFSRKTKKRIAKSRRHRHRKGYADLVLRSRIKHKKRARPAIGGAVARKRARKSRRKGRRKVYRFTKARRLAALRNVRKARRARRGGKKSHRKARRYSARTMRTIRSRRGPTGRRSQRKGTATLRRARRYLKGRRRVGSLARSYARRWGLRSNPDLKDGIAIMQKAGFAFGGLVATSYLPGLLLMIPGAGVVLGAAGAAWLPLLGAVAAGLVLWWATGTKFMPGIVQSHRTEILIGAGLGVLQQALAPVMQAIGGGGGGGGGGGDDMGDTWTEGTMPLADYVADGTSLGDYVPELGLDVEQALAGYVREGPISQALAGLGSPAATAMVRSGRLGSGAAWTASGPIPPRPMWHLGASYGGIFTRPLF